MHPWKELVQLPSIHKIPKLYNNHQYIVVYIRKNISKLDVTFLTVFLGVGNPNVPWKSYEKWRVKPAFFISF